MGALKQPENLCRNRTSELMSYCIVLFVFNSFSSFCQLIGSRTLLRLLTLMYVGEGRGGEGEGGRGKGEGEGG